MLCPVSRGRRRRRIRIDDQKDWQMIVRSCFLKLLVSLEPLFDTGREQVQKTLGRSADSQEVACMMHLSSTRWLVEQEV